MFEVTIREIKIKTFPGGHEWKPLRDIPSPEIDGKLEREYGYTPEVMVQKEFSEEIYKQKVEELDVIAVINAINKIQD